jgi:hypothetical protein
MFDEALFNADGASSPLSFSSSNGDDPFSSSESFHTSSSSSINEDEELFPFVTAPAPLFPSASLLGVTSSFCLFLLC